MIGHYFGVRPSAQLGIDDRGLAFDVDACCALKIDRLFADRARQRTELLALLLQRALLMGEVGQATGQSIDFRDLSNEYV